MSTNIIRQLSQTRDAFGSTSHSKSVQSHYQHPNDPELVCKDRELPASIEDEIKDGFYELKQKFKDVGPSSIYISHTVIHAKHPILSKLTILTLKQILTASSVLYLA